LPQVNGHACGTLGSTHSFDWWCRGAPMHWREDSIIDDKTNKHVTKTEKVSTRAFSLLHKVVGCVQYASFIPILLWSLF
jgi:hypothetical protein